MFVAKLTNFFLSYVTIVVARQALLRSNIHGQ